jgi:hypothetical protein
MNPQTFVFSRQLSSVSGEPAGKVVGAAQAVLVLCFIHL